MAQNSIARLAVQIVTDTGGMTQGFRQAQAHTIRFANSIDSTSHRLARLGKVGADATKMFSGLGGAGGLVFKLAGIAGPLGLAAAATTALAVGMGRAAIASEDFRIERLRELGRLSPDIKTTAEALGGVREQLSILNEVAYKSLVGDNLKRLSVNFENAFKNIGETFAPEAFAKITAERALAKDDSLLVLKRKADELVKTLRTPTEVFGDTVGELLKMREQGFITWETLSRGAAKAAEDFRRAAGEARRVRDEVVGIPSAEMGSQAARSAFLRNAAAASSRGGGGSSETERKIAATLERIEAIDREILKKPTVKFSKAGL